MRALCNTGRTKTYCAVVLSDHGLCAASSGQSRPYRLVGNDTKRPREIGLVAAPVPNCASQWLTRLEMRQGHASRCTRLVPIPVFGATYVVLSPEHPLVRALPRRPCSVMCLTMWRPRLKDLVARQKTDKTKTGVPTGSFCRNPATGRNDSDLGRRLRTHGVRDRGDNGRAWTRLRVLSLRNSLDFRLSGWC